MSISETYLYWLDLETTGLDADKDVILEVAMVRTLFDEPMRPIAAYHAVLGLQGSDPKTWHPKVQEMHAKSGLIEECAASTRSVADVQAELLRFCPEPFELSMRASPGALNADGTKPEDKWTLAGSNVHFDHRFLDRHMPLLAKRFMHRYLCVSAVKVFCRTLGMTRPPKGEAHRAKEDIQESMRHLAHCRTWLAMPETAILGWSGK